MSEDNQKKTRVVIVGAGVGGLASAYQLLHPSRAGAFEVTLLEANARVGGRCMTLRPGDTLQERGGPLQTCTFLAESGQRDTPYLNAGPGRIPSAHQRLLGYLAELEVELEVYVMESRSNLVYRREIGRSEPVRRYAADVRGRLAELLASQVELLGGFGGTRQAEFLELLRAFGELDDSNCYGRAATRAGYRRLPGVAPGLPVEHRSLGELLTSGFWRDQFYQVQDFLWQATSFQPVGGMDRVAMAFADQVRAWGGTIACSSPVETITRDPNGPGPYRVDYVDPGGERKSVHADVCISNAAIPLLNRLLGDGLDGQFRDAVAHVASHGGFLQPAVKVGWQAKRALWQRGKAPGEVPTFGGIDRTSHEMAQIWFPSTGFHDEYGVLTGAYVNHVDRALRWGRMSPTQRLAEARSGAAELRGREFAAALDHGLTVAWQNMPYIGGGWVDWHQVGNYRRAYIDVLRGHDDSLFVCGDQLSTLPGWMEGAVASAEYTVRRITGEAEFVERVEDIEIPNIQQLIRGH